MNANHDKRRSWKGRSRAFELLLLVLAIAAAAWWILLGPRGPSHRGRNKVGTVEHPALSEISGIAVSRQNRGVIWAHNDSGDSARLFALRTDGSHRGVFRLSGAKAIDYEDMAIGPGPLPGIDYLYVADTGNNDLIRTTVTAYRVPEPILKEDGRPVTGILKGVEALPMKFPGRPHECETLLVDPLNGDLYLITRDRTSVSGGFSLVFRNPAPQQPGVRRTLKLVARFPAPVAIKGGDMSPDGSTILLRAHSMTKPANALRWTWNRERTLAQVFSEPGQPLPAASEQQGEAIAFSADGLSYFTIGERPRAPIYQYSTGVP